MTERSVRFERIGVRRVMGISHEDGFELSGLSPGVNLIYGPNGSGKSTAALVLQELLWPGRTGLERPTVNGSFRDAETDWRIEIDAGHVETTCDGKPGSLPELGPPENRGRYRLALHELVSGDNAEFAKLIADASHGGYDLEAAAKELRFSDRPSAPSKQARLLKESLAEVKDATRGQREVEREEEQLPALRSQRMASAEALRQIDLLEKAKAHIEAEANSGKIKLQLDALPLGMSRVYAGDRETLDKLDERRVQLDEERRSEDECIKQATLTLEEVSLPAAGVGKDVVSGLRAGQRKLKDIEGDLQRHRQELDKADVGESRARTRLGAEITDDHLGRIDTVEIEGLSTFSRAADKVRARNQVIEERRALLAAEERESIRGLGAPQIRDGITALAHWLAAATPDTTLAARLGWPIFAAAGLLALLGVALAYLYHPAWLLLMLVAAGLLLLHRWMLKSSSGAGSGTSRRVHRESYQATGLKPPPAWETAAVVRMLRSLTELAQRRAQEDERLRQLKTLDVEAQSVASAQQDVEQQRRDIVEHLGVEIDVADEWLPLLVENISLWQSCSTKVAESRRAVTGLEKERDEQLEQINAGLGPFGYTPIDSAESALGLIDGLAERQSSHDGAVQQKSGSQGRIGRTIDPALQNVAQERSQLFERLHLDESDEARIDEWITELPNYHLLRKEWDEAETLREDRRATLAADAELLDLSLLEIQQQLEDQQRIADKRDELSEKIADIEGAIERAKDGHELSDLLSDQQAAKSELEESREQNGAAVTGALLTNWVRTVAIESSRPQVFSRARELLVRLTRGRLLLELDDQASPPKFRARSGSGPPQPVENLSTGERVQLLIAVRLAFLEQDEPTRLPLLLDEALGTSDDGRAGEIIDTIIEVAREGRQIFYFTAQHDEVGKWIARLENSGVPYEVIDLGEVRKLDAAASNPLQIVPVELPEPPGPEGRTHDEYGVALGVPDIDPASDGIDGLHLWHVIDDVDRLHTLLRRRIVSWGQLQRLHQYGGEGLVEDGEMVLKQASVAAQAIDAACRAWRVGRGKPVDRRALQDSGCVSDTFIDEVAGLASRLNGDAQAVLEALETGGVARWRETGTICLRDFFETNGFLVSDEPLSAADIRVRVLAAVADDLREDRLTDAFVDRVVGSFDTSTARREPDGPAP